MATETKSKKTGKRSSKKSHRQRTILRREAPDARSVEQWTSRVEFFADMAQRRARGELVLLPAMLPKEERRLYVRRTLLEDHRFRIQNRPEGASAKFAKLADSVWNFFRGTALLYYRDRVGSDAHLPTVLTMGDVHPENFGVMPNDDGAPVFGLNDFDEAFFAPFSWDVKRGAAGFMLCTEQNGISRKHSKKTVRAFVGGYLDGLKSFAENDREKWHEYRIDNSPPMIRTLLENSITQRRDFLSELIDLDKGEFRSGDEVVPHSAHLEEFQQVIDRYSEQSEIRTREADGHFQVKDVAIKKDSGTASLGLDRYLVLIDGRSDAPEDDILLELKQARQSALTGLAPAADRDDGKAERIFQTQQVHLVGGDRYYGATEIDGQSFLVRERSPYKDDIDVDDLDVDEWREYASICGQVLAQAHARSDEDTGAMEGNAEEAILGSIERGVFIDDVVRHAKSAAARVRMDHRLFRKDHALGVFDTV